MKRLLDRFLPSDTPLTIAGAGRFTEVKRASSVLLGVVVVVFIVLGIWAALAAVDTVTRAEGKVVPSARLQVVQNLEGGIIESIAVRQGQSVAQGDLLVTLNAAQSGADLNIRSQQVLALMARMARYGALAEGHEPQFEARLKTEGAEFVTNELAAYLGKKGEQESQMAVLSAQVIQRRKEWQEAQVTAQTAAKTLAIAHDERVIMVRMVERGLEPRLELIRLDRSMADAEGRAESAKMSMTRIDAAIDETESRKQAVSRQFRAEALAELNKTLAELRALQESMPALQDKVNRAELRAPVSGIVNRVLVSTVGGVIKPGEPVVEIVPADDQLVVEALVDPKDIAFIHIGQLAKVKLTAYDYSIYGAMDGRIAHISPDAVPVGEQGRTFYQVRIETNTRTIESLGRKLPVIPGMQAQVDIVTGNNTVLQYLTKPLVGVKENAFRER